MKSALLFLVAALAPACGSSDGTGATTTDDTTDTDAALAEGQQRGAATADLVDAELAANPIDFVIAKSAAIAITLDRGEIMQAQAALQVTTDPRVREFATHMIEEHSNHLEATASMLAAVELQEQDNPVAGTLRAEAETGVVAIQDAADPDFEYMRLQVTMHAEADLVVGALEDNAPDSQIGEFYANTRADIQAHLDGAVSLSRDLE